MFNNAKINKSVKIFSRKPSSKVVFTFVKLLKQSL